jgi:hypothetical protein
MAEIKALRGAKKVQKGRCWSRRNKNKHKLEAKLRSEARALRSPLQQLQRLDIALGIEIGAVKERARLNAFQGVIIANG